MIELEDYIRVYTESESPLQVGLVEEQAPFSSKERNEDQVSMRMWEGTPLGDIAAFCVFDGHNGEKASLIAARRFLNFIQDAIIDAFDAALWSSENQFKERIKSLFLDFDNIIEDMQSTYSFQGGCTAIAVFIIKDLKRVYVCNVGDSSALLLDTSACKDTNVPCDAIVLGKSPVHNPATDFDRMISLVKANPTLLGKEFRECSFDPQEDALLACPGKRPFISGLREGVMKRTRVFGKISTTRVFGDSRVFAGLEKDVLLKSLLTAEPDITTFDNFDSNGYILVLASDGIWDFIREDEVSRLSGRLKSYDVSSLNRLAKDLTRAARRRGSRDDISCIIIHFYTVFN